jgi:LCP family protein required for cell wall assembly
MGFIGSWSSPLPSALRSTDSERRLVTTKTKILIVLASVVVGAVLFAGWQGVRAWTAWNRIDRVAFDLETARSELPPSPPDIDEVSTPAPTVSIVEYQTILLIGSDEKAPEFQEGAYADAVMFYLLPDDGSGPLIVSLPRDLIVVDPCTGEETKLDRTLAGCGDAIGGEELVALAVEDFTGVGVDNFASFRFEAFVAAVDAVGGVEICVPRALREGAAELLPMGCSEVDGTTALRWIRSRKTQELVGDEWQFVEDVGDLARVQRQQVLLFALLDRLKGIRSPGDLAGIAEELGSAIVLDETLQLAQAVSMVWDLRSVSGSSIRTLTIPTESVVLPDGSFAVRATVTFAELIGQ